MCRIELVEAAMPGMSTPESRYKDILLLADEDGILCEECDDDDRFADLVASSLRSRVGRCPAKPAKISKGLQGNLCEFCVWELGECHWQIYTRINTWPANARNPWRHGSKSGIDIVAIDTNAETLYLIEVKSRRDEGSSAISSTEDSLKEDFRHLFEGSLDLRIWDSINEVVASLIDSKNLDLAAKVVDAVGDTPEECTGVHLIGVLVCNGGGKPRSRNARKRAFERLHRWLLEQGWRKEQCEYRCIELSSLGSWLNRLVSKVVE